MTGGSGEVNFSYSEAGENKQALVKLVTCERFSVVGFKLGSEKHTTEVIVKKSGTLQVTSGIEGLALLKTTKVTSGIEGLALLKTTKISFCPLLDDTQVRKVRGGICMTNVWNLIEGEWIPTQFNENGQLLSTEGGIFAQFTGCIACVPNQIPLDAVDWRIVPTTIKEDCWNIMTKRFVIPEGPLGGDIVKQRFSKIWEKNGGTTNEKEKQVSIDRAELYEVVHSHFDGLPMNLDVAEKIRQMEEIQVNDPTISQILSQSRTSGSISWSPSDHYAQEQCENQNVANPNLDQILLSIPRSSHGSRKTFDDSVGADGAGTGAGAEAAND
ncbi:Uricase-2 isozyme 1 [Morella rubra]|uniref:Uricase-2 isozyme 1 n=1 Tax=Morella rubra TaxID=262757 RepID=A0A6A1VJY4_9ROSI|nr:Uricase-2 isozyme 1 [Morella rubra]